MAMTEPNTVVVDFHIKRYSDFDLLRISRAVRQIYQAPVTAYLVDAYIPACTAIGVVFGHDHFLDGHRIRTSDIQYVEKEGRFWVLTTLNSRYVVATFKRDGGRNSLRDFLRVLEHC